MLIRRMLLALALATTLSGCAALAKWLPIVINSLGQAAQVLDSIESVADSYFAANPDPEKQKRYARVMGAARASLAASHAAAKGGDAAAKQDVDKAFAEFQKAYQEILALLGPLGVVAPADDGTLGAPADGPLRVPAQLTLE